ncbi:LLM class F420-dependent oxidoreductase [Nocardioides marmoriginsengisoli]|uniref:LLM class F420-dependent oxidoreductase n=1 Tax=Nocardioides marmoriginsengisoli TaxID=661483 RepID=A0A3N0CGJ3_9ACTN|nr:LLM class F420-dependent oxidoreductase [Nocardioides marmoriginsengisoli]RNL62557.1 LLM class F420-dependent oxidoreductase [Nocardioides marmoriginsengisoli]
MRLGLHLVNFDFEGPVGPALAEIGAAVEEAGFDNLSVMDHYLQLEFMGPPSSSMLEGYTTLGFLAAHTSTVDLQLLVTGVTYRHPGVLGKIVATLDALSGGRAVLGLGAAWYEREHRALGIPYPPLSERFERLEETVQVVRQLWSDDDGPYDGRHYQLAETICSPKPVRPVPIMIGGSGEQKTLRLVARYADACNLFASAESGPEAIAAKLEVLRRHCADLGRDYDAVAKTILWTGDCEPAGFVEAMKPYADLGVSEVHVMHLGAEPLALVRALAPQVGELRSL